MIYNIIIPRFGIVGSGLQYEANFHWKNWTRPVANWVFLLIFIKNTKCSKNQNEKRLKSKIVDLQGLRVQPDSWPAHL